MKAFSLIMATVLLGGCATIIKEVKGPGGYKYTESIKAIGGGNIKRAAQSFGGTLKVHNPDGSLHIEVKLDSEQEGEDVSSDTEAILAGLALFGRLSLPVP